MKLTFWDRNNEERLIGIYPTEKEALLEIKRFLRNHYFKAHYYKITNFHDKKVYDVGSWSEFFVLYDNDDEPLNTRGVWEE